MTICNIFTIIFLLRGHTYKCSPLYCFEFDMCGYEWGNRNLHKVWYYILGQKNYSFWLYVIPSVFCLLIRILFVCCWFQVLGILLCLLSTWHIPWCWKWFQTQIQPQSFSQTCINMNISLKIPKAFIYWVVYFIPYQYGMNERWICRLLALELFIIYCGYCDVYIG